MYNYIGDTVDKPKYRTKINQESWKNKAQKLKDVCRTRHRITIAAHREGNRAVEMVMKEGQNPQFMGDAGAERIYKVMHKTWGVGIDNVEIHC